MRRSRSSLIAVLLLAASLTAGIALPADGAAHSLFGAYATRRSGENSIQAFQHLETSLGRPLAIVRMFYSWNSGFNAGATSTLEGWAKAQGKVPVISVKTKMSNGSAVKWADIAAAQPGSALYQQMVTWANRMKAWGGPVYFCLNHEASNTKSLANGVASEYIAAWHKIHEIFAARHVTNVIWTWIMGDPTPWEVPPNDRRYGYKWYPGDEVVDVLAVDVYNWACNGGPNYRSFDSLTQKFLEFAALHPDKATMVTEYGTSEDPNDPNAKAQWIRDAAKDVKSWNDLQAFMAFHSQYAGGCHWWLDSSPQALDAARAVGRQKFFS